MEENSFKFFILQSRSLRVLGHDTHKKEESITILSAKA